MYGPWGKAYDVRAPFGVRGGIIANMRVVPGFSIQSLQKDTITYCPDPAGSTCPRCPKKTKFRRHYDMGDFPIMTDQNNGGRQILWKNPPENLDYEYFLPLFFEGLRELEHPYSFFARQGIRDMLFRGCHKVLSAVPHLIHPIRDALNTRCYPVLIATLKAMQELAVCAPGVGDALVPYYRMLLPILSIFRNKNKCLGDLIEYGQYKRENLGDLIQETLEIFERYGGPDAFINIKYMIPNYESVILQ